MYIENYRISGRSKSKKIAKGTFVLHNADTFLSKYEMGEFIAEGGFGAVHKCNIRNQKEIRAVKKILKNGASLETFEDEMSMLSVLPHPNII